MTENLLRNGGFEADWGEDESHRCLVFPKDEDPYETDVGNIFTPPGWVTWFRHDEGTWDQPEVRDAWREHDADRVRSGDKGMLLFTFYRKHDAGFLQQVEVEPGARLRLAAWAHAWSNHLSEQDGGHPHDGNWSDGAGYEKVAWLEGTQPLTGDPVQDAKSNFTFWVGIDPGGGMDPFADSVVWGDGYHIYNGYVQELSVEVEAQAGMVTVFLRSKTIWPFNHNDAYWDDAALEAVGEPAPVPPEPEEPGEADGFSRLGPHVLKAVEDLGEYLQSPIGVAKFVGDWGMAANLSASVLVIGRKVSDYDAQYLRERMTPAEGAQKFVMDQMETYLSNLHIRYWEGPNEPVWSDEAGMGWYAEFEVERMRLMADLGLKCVIGNFSTGCPPLELWPAFLPALRKAKGYQAILGLHEYSCPWMWWMTGAFQVDPSEDEGDEGWTTLRYRKVYRQYLIPNGLGDVPLVITECGIDPLVSPLPPGVSRDDVGAWQGLGEFWREHDGESDAADYYYRQLAWYDEELQKDDYVVGATVFTWGNWGGAWKDFEVGGTEVAKKLIAHVNQYPAREFVYPGDVEPPPAPIPTPDRGAPREQYERTYVLMFPGADAEWTAAVVRGSWNERRYTVGGSADDAGIGDLDYRRVMAVNPERWTDSLQAFFEEYYPGVEYVPVYAASPAELESLLKNDQEAPPPIPPVPTTPMLVGLHDEPGGVWLADSFRSEDRPDTVCLVHRKVQTSPVTLDFSYLYDRNVTVIARLNWGYADGTGTVPPPEHKEAWIGAMTRSIIESKGIHVVVIGNEINNPVEWPGGYPSPSFVVSPQYYVDLYNEIVTRVRGGQGLILFAPAALDPYNIVAGEFGQPADPREWAWYLYDHCVEVNAIALHAKTQGGDPSECTSTAEFSDAPLLDRYLHLRTVEDQVGWVPLELRDVPIYVTEVNPQRKRDGELGWDIDGDVWVHAACGYFRSFGLVDGVMLYRYELAGDQAAFGLADKAHILEAIRQEVVNTD